MPTGRGAAGADIYVGLADERVVLRASADAGDGPRSHGGRRNKADGVGHRARSYCAQPVNIIAIGEVGVRLVGGRENCGGRLLVCDAPHVARLEHGASERLCVLPACAVVAATDQLIIGERDGSGAAILNIEEFVV